MWASSYSPVSDLVRRLLGRLIHTSASGSCVGSGQTQVKRPVWIMLLLTESSQRLDMSFLHVNIMFSLLKLYLCIHLNLCILTPYDCMCLEKPSKGFGSHESRDIGSCDTPSVGTENPSYLFGPASCSLITILSKETESKLELEIIMPPCLFFLLMMSALATQPVFVSSSHFHIICCIIF